MLMRPLAEQRGITLIEIMLAVAMIGVGLVALSSAIPLSSYGIHEGSHLSTATFLANQRLEQVRSAKWKRVPSGCGGASPGEVDALGVSPSATAAPVSTCVDGVNTATVTTFPDEASVAAPYTDYARTVRIFGCASGCNAVATGEMRQVIVTVTYRPMTGRGMSAAGTAKAATVTMYVAMR